MGYTTPTPIDPDKVKMRTVIVASTNPVKIEAARLGFARLFPDQAFAFEGVSTPSGVSDQPMTGPETLQGALNRAHRARDSRPDADFWIGIEGGIEEAGEQMQAFAWVVILSERLVGKSKTGAFCLPRQVADLVRQGKELGDADDIIFNRTNSKQDTTPTPSRWP